ncbi:MAG: hypothetical protein ACTSVY_09035 [Candidatus Helarchaeota archaeon]
MRHFESIKMILGDMGIKILEILKFGRMDIESINFLSGIPIACIKGRIPVLKSLNLIIIENGYLSLDKNGKDFLLQLEGYRNL